MKKILKFSLLCILTLFLNCSEDTVDLIEYGVFTGRVVVANSFEPIENAKVTINPTNNAVFTDEEGYFRLEEIEAGDYSVQVSKESYLTNYQPGTISAEKETNLIFEMEDDDSLNKPPSEPVIISPEDNSENNEISLELQWSEAQDPDDDEIMYNLEIRNDYDNEIINVTDLNDTTYVLSNLRYGTKYFWQVEAFDEITEVVKSSVSSFKTKVDPENRYLYVKKAANNNSLIFSASFKENIDEPETEVQLTVNDQNSWRPRKNQTTDLIAFLRTINNETHLFTMKPNGSNIKQVTSAVPVAGYDLNEIDFSWSSNGDRLIYPHYDKLYLINKDGSGLTEIYNTEDGSYITECDFSTDESIIVIKTNDVRGYNSSILAIDMEGNVLTTVISNALGAVGGLNISVDNKYILYSYDVSDFQSSNNRQLDTRIFLYNFSSNTSTDISSGKIAGTIDIDPRFSPNEAEVIFVNTSNDGISSKNIFRMTIGDENNERLLLFANAIMPDWE